MILTAIFGSCLKAQTYKRDMDQVTQEAPLIATILLVDWLVTLIAVLKKKNMSQDKKC